VIVAVDGPTAAGKTTWCRAAAVEFVAEYAPTGSEPDGSAGRQAQYWTEVNGARWSQALDLEERVQVAICDTDPIKLHYSWCLARIGAAPASRFAHELVCVREAMSDKQLGFADVVLVTAPNEKTLRLQKEGDPTRSRRSFELHAKLREPLIEWYQCLNRLQPGQVLWELPEDGVSSISGTARADRYDLRLLDSLIRELPELK
jgi:nicotinamide riboside kinase